MKKNKGKLRKKIYPMIWSGVIAVSIYLLIRFASLFLSDNLGQANLTLQDAALTKLYCKAMEEGSSIICYVANDKAKESFPVSMMDSSFALQNFTEDSSTLTAKAVQFSSIPPGFAALAGDADITSKTSNVNNASNANNTRSENNINRTNSTMGIGNNTMKSADASDNGSDATGAVETMDMGGVRNNLDIYAVKSNFLSKEYILTNGKVFSNKSATSLADTKTDTDVTAKKTGELQVDYSRDNTYYEETEDSVVSGDSAASGDNSSVETVNPGSVKYSLDQLKDLSFLIHNFYTVDSSTRITESLFDAKTLLGKDMTMKQSNEKPQILIYHTHSQEAYTDSRSGVEEDTVVGVGSRLTEILEEKYGYNVIHDKTKYDLIDGKEDRSKAYNYAEKGLDKTLEDNPTVEVVIDLHRDSGEARTTMINGKETAKIMLFNGLSRDQNGPITYLDNPNLQDNLAFSLQVKLKSLDLYPGLFIKNYLKSYRFNMQVRPKCLLIELGTINNTLESANNAMEPLAEVLNAVFQGK